MARLNILLIVLDTVRADHLSCYGYDRQTTPALDLVAEEGILFESAVASSIWTVPSHASIFSGLHLSEHRLNSAGWQYRLNPAISLLPEILQQAGYQTAAFSNNPYIAPFTGLSRGFDILVGEEQLAARYDTSYITRVCNLLQRTPAADYLDRRGLTRRAERTVQAMLQWLQGWDPDSGPFFAFANFMEAHAPYDPPVRFARRFRSHRVRQLIREFGQPESHLYNTGCLEISGEHRAAWCDLYDAELAYLDDQIGHLYRKLQHLGLLDSTLLVVTSDHGENLGEHGLHGHMLCLYDTLLMVPLILRHPDLLHRGSIAANVQLCDLFPTLLQTAEVPFSNYGAQTERPGLFSHLASSHETEDFQPAFSEFYDDGPLLETFREINPEFNRLAPFSGLTCIRTDTHKYIQATQGTDEFYDLATDPGEITNLIGYEPPELPRLRSELESWKASRTNYPMGPPEAKPDQAEEEALRRRLAGFGYL